MSDGVAKSYGTAVLLCGDLANRGAGLNVEELCASLPTVCPGTSVKVVTELCRKPGKISAAVTDAGADRAVLGLCSGEYPRIELQARARKAGLDPFGLEIVPLGTLCAQVHSEPEATLKARLLLAAAVARAQAFSGSGPEHARLYFLPPDQKVSRRSLFTVPPIGYQPVPGIRAEQCVTQSGCQVCVENCPPGALEKSGGYISRDKNRCGGCGICLAVCPRQAIDFPGWSLAQFAAQLAALLGTVVSDTEPRGLLFTCSRTVGQLEELARRNTAYCSQWLPVIVPCLGMVTPAWVFQALAHGAEAVALLSCRGDCPLGQEPTIGGRVNYCRRLLSSLGQSPERVTLFHASSAERLLEELQQPPWRDIGNHVGRFTDRWNLGTLAGALRAIQFLGDGRGVSNVVLEHPCSPFGKLEFTAGSCTGCLSCVKTCPTAALASESRGDELIISFDASLCTGCATCVNTCPESAAHGLRLRRITDLDALSGGRVVLHREQMAVCEGCGAAIASLTLLRRIEASLGEDAGPLRTALKRYCPACRVSFAWGARPSSVLSGE